ncbi:ABC transporter permease [Erythrobacter sp.]|jgi:putative ABC transport system permease protein|uniref:ABC transporter permease n=1 Tax=Erythrobacter sp. TaxID=1042 RepID=UPI002EABA0FF|nr:ABC transporter permease [Erythrobacter sp.]
MISLAIAYLKDRPLTSALNVALLAISVALLVLLLQFGHQAGERLERDARGIDLVVGAKGSPLQLILSAVFHIDRPTGNIPLDSLDLLRRDPAVERAVPIALGDNFAGYRIVGTDDSFMALYGAELASGRTFDEPMEAVLGSEVARATGAGPGQAFVSSHGLADEQDAEQGHGHAPFETVGVLVPTGTVVDRLVLTPYESVWDVHGIAHGRPESEHAHDHESAAGDAGAPDQPGRRSALTMTSRAPEAELTALLVTYRNAAGALRIPALVNRQTAMQAAVPASETARLLDLLGASLEGVRVLGWLLAVTGGLAIFVALLNMVRSREGDLALLRVMGASRMQVFATVLLEGVVTAVLGAALGWFAAHGLIAAARANFATLGNLGLAAWHPLPEELLLVAAVLGLGALAALIPALRIYRVDAARILARS